MELEKEKQLVERARKDPESFGLLFDEYYDSILKFVLKRTGHLESSQDITAEVFFKAYKNLWQFRFRSIRFGAWLYKIATNEANNYFKRGKRAPIPTAFMEALEHVMPHAQMPEAEFIEKENGNKVLQDTLLLYESVQKLPVKYQEVIALKYFEEKSIKEISEILSKKEGTVKSLISRGIDLLEKAMQPSVTSNVIQVKTINSTSHEQAGH